MNAGPELHNEQLFIEAIRQVQQSCFTSFAKLLLHIAKMESIEDLFIIRAPFINTLINEHVQCRLLNGKIDQCAASIAHIVDRIAI